MKTLVIALAAATALTAGAAAAQPYGYARQDDYRRYDNNGRYDNSSRYDTGRWISIDERQVQLDRRIDQGVRNGQLTRAEAYRLRGQFNGLMRLEARYRYNGLSPWERADLDRRFDVLAQEVRFERRDRDRTYGYNTYPRPRY